MARVSEVQLVVEIVELEIDDRHIGDVAALGEIGQQPVHPDGSPCARRGARGSDHPDLLGFDASGDHLVDHGIESHGDLRSEEHTSELQSLMRISYAVFCLKKKNEN